MNVIKCKECKKELNIFSGYCPNCGHKTKRNLTIIIIGIAILLLLAIFIIKPILIDNKGYYSQREINKIKLNNDTKELLEDNGVSEELVTSYVQDYMEQYNNYYRYSYSWVKYAIFQRNRNRIIFSNSNIFDGKNDRYHI